MKSKLIQVLFGLGALSIAVFIITGYVAECRAGDVCLEQKINVKREEKQAYLDRIAVIDEEIEAFKKQLTVGYAVEKLKSGDTKQVSKDILGFKANLHVVQQAYADTSDQGVTSSQEISLSTEETTLDSTRYQAYLTSKGSPFANVDIGLHCARAALNVDQCDMLVAISGSESSFGTKYRKLDRTTGKIVEANEEGKGKHNPVGIKGGGISYPTADGFYIRQFESWDDFWAQYTKIMKQGYFDRGGNSLAVISKCYVSGDCRLVKTGWTQRGEQFIAEIKQSLLVNKS